MTIWYAQNAALNVLYKIERIRALPLIIKALHSPKEQVRRQTVMLLLQDPHPGAADALRSVLDDPDFETRFYARQVLDMIGEDR